MQRMANEQRSKEETRAQLQKKRSLYILVCFQIQLLLFSFFLFELGENKIGLETEKVLGGKEERQRVCPYMGPLHLDIMQRESETLQTSQPGLWDTPLLNLITITGDDIVEFGMFTDCEVNVNKPDFAFRR